MTIDPETTTEPPRWRIVAALALVATLVVALVLVVRDNSSVGTAAGTTSTTITTSATVTTSSVDDALMSDLEAALEAWGVFAATGDIAAVDGFFAPDGPQYAQLESEVADRLGSAPGLPAFAFVVVDPQLVRQSDGAAVFRGDVSIERTGVSTSVFRWDIEMRRDASGRWRLWTVSSADG